METKPKTRARVAILSEEMDGIHFTNALYWERGEAATLKARAAYERRQRRLEEIRNELFPLRSSDF
jgi:hypothetical protein